MTMGDETAVVPSDKCPFCDGVHELKNCIDFAVRELYAEVQNLEKRVKKLEDNAKYEVD